MESRWGWGRDFPHLSRPALGPTQRPAQWVPGLSRGVKSSRGVTLAPHRFYCRGQEGVELYLYFPYGPYGLYRASYLYKGALYLYRFLKPLLKVISSARMTYFRPFNRFPWIKTESVGI